ncbi:MAG: WecB/TagA/CpsF family glycosyltransferase [Cyanobacteriota bacterium]|nr:WecB/TagA/CpsF family glycosyltransferase [Cyanobacteriota bacterium]
MSPSTATNGTEPLQARVLGVPVNVCDDVLASAIALHAKGGGQIVTLNAEMTMAALADPALEGAIRGADLVIPDGAGVVWALGRQGIRVRRAPGIELARNLLNHAATHGWRVALVGSSPPVLEQVCYRLKAEIPGLQLVMTIHGYNDPEAWPELEQRLLSMHPDLVLVALGVPRQELWVQRLPHPLEGIWMGVGGSFDVWAGTKKRAPLWMGMIHLEWLYRLIQEPSRWRRMLALPAFMGAVLSGSPPRPATRRQEAGRRGE